LARRLQGLLTNKHNFCEGALMCRLSPPEFPIQLKLFFPVRCARELVSTSPRHGQFRLLHLKNGRLPPKFRSLAGNSDRDGGKLHGLASHASAKIDHRILARPGSAFRFKSPGHLARIKMGYSDELPLPPVALVALVRAVIEGAGR
jgi:hypothetical protein